MDLEFREPDGDGEATFGDLARFVKKAQASGVQDDHPLLLERDERDGSVTGFSIYLPVDF
ncbi:hypothetical protein ACSBOX_11785 [Arthrobacter sp. KN11-1C]|uniref:hypothetical protein n=1 Tax=Arthrobacter sp. KN11-1C TaxID=3445774 RepID=UPI003FA0E453